MLSATNLSKIVSSSESELTILDSISFNLAQGRSLAILGESGSGKTTLLGLLAGLDTPSGGEVKIKDQALFELSEEDRARVRKDYLGFVFQNFQLIDSLTTLENVMMPLELKGDRQARTKAQTMLDKVGLKARYSHYPNQLSGGEQQRVAIARAFVTQPKLLLADEPTGNLDTATGDKIIELMFSLNKSLDTTLVLVTHDVHLAQRCDESLTLSAGKMLAHNTDLRDRDFKESDVYLPEPIKAESRQVPLEQAERVEASQNE